MHPFRELAENRKLRRYYFAIQISGLLALLVFGLLIYLFKSEFSFLGNTDYTIIAILAMFVIHGSAFVFESFSTKKFFFDIGSYSWMAFFLFVVINSGGVDSQFLFLLIFPTLVAAADLDDRAVALRSAILTFAFGLIIFLHPENLFSPILIVKHAMRTTIFGCLTYYVYKLVRETLRQKFEKEEAKRQFLELIEINKVKTDFLAVAQHQLRTPLSGARFGIDTILKEGHLDEETLKLEREIQNKIERALSIINEMLSTAELSSKSLVLKNAEVDLTAIIEKGLSELEFLRRKNEMTVTFSPAHPVLVRGDQKMLSTAISHILDNALRYGAKGKVEISLLEDFEVKKATIIVSDHGIGISKDDLPYIFERFYRGRNAISASPNESGIGLYISKRIIELHGGVISIDSEKAKGTIVTVTLPVL